MIHVNTYMKKTGVFPAFTWLKGFVHNVFRSKRTRCINADHEHDALFI
jgi:hypothetical protein